MKSIQAKKNAVIAKSGGKYGGKKRLADPALVEAPIVVKAVNKIPRFSFHIVFAVGLFALVVWLAPQTGATSPQANVVQTLAYALSRVSLGGVVGYLLSLSVFKNIHLDFTSPRDPVTAMLILARAIIVLGCVIALTLGG